MSLFQTEVLHFLEQNVNVIPHPFFSHLHCGNFELMLIPLSPISADYKNQIYELKKEYKFNNQKLIILWEDVWLTKNEIVKSRLMVLMGKGERIFARKTTVKVIDIVVSTQFLNQHHLQGGTKAKFKFGLFTGEELVAVATFGPSLLMKNELNPYISYGWIRYASKKGTIVVGGMSKIMKYFVQMVQPGGITSYVDFDWANGESYEKLGFELVEITPCQSFYINDNNERIYPHKIKESIEFIDNQTNKVFNAGNLKYIKRFYEK